MSEEAKIRTKPSDRLDSFNGLMYVINRAISNKVNTVLLVKVVGVNDDGTINVIQALDSTNTDGDRISSTAIKSINVFRYQAGTNAVIIPPKVGDIGLLLVSKYDISGFNGGVVVNNSEFNYGDGIYLGGVLGLNQTPTEKIEFTDTGIVITSTKNVSINAKNVDVNAEKVNVNATTEMTLGKIEGQTGVGIAKIGSRITSDGTSSGTTVGFVAEGSLIVRSV